MGGEDYDYDEPAGLHGLRGEEVEIVLPTAPVKPRSKPIVCSTGASTELYANPRNCRLVSNSEVVYVGQRATGKGKWRQHRFNITFKDIKQGEMHAILDWAGF